MENHTNTNDIYMGDLKSKGKINFAAVFMGSLEEKSYISTHS